MSCRKDVHPQRNLLIDKHFIWQSMSQLYGTQNLTEFQKKTGFVSARWILRDMEFRRIHLQSRLHTHQNNLSEQLALHVEDEQLLDNVKDLCRKIQNMANEMRDIDKIMGERDIDLQQISEQHKKIAKNFDSLCDKLTFFIEQQQMGEDNFDTTTYKRDKGEICNGYHMKRLPHLSTDQNVANIDISLSELNSRKQWLTFNLETIRRLPSTDISPNEGLQKIFEKAMEKVLQLDDLMDKLTYLRGNLRAIERMASNYSKLLYNRQQPDIPGSRFIYLLETLRIRVERFEVARNFPNTHQLINYWQNDYGTEDDFKPKILDLCQTIERDLKDLFTEHSSIYSVPYRIGVVGYTSVGKSALIIKLTNLIQFSSMVSLERSTFGYLQFDTYFVDKSSKAKKIPISFIDIAGAIENDTSKSDTNYLELIENSDCDLYMIVFDKALDQRNQIWLNHIEKILGRKYLLVRSKVDVLFHQFYREETGEKFQNESSKQCHIRSALERARQHSSHVDQPQPPEGQVFLTAAGVNNDLNDAPFGQFDLEKLKKALHRSALADMRVARVSRLAILASRTAINTCFRRGYTVSKTKYRWLAAGASLIPLLDEVPAFFGREKLRQAFGIHDCSSLRNTIRGTTNSLEEYLTEHQFTIPEALSKSGYFDYLISSVPLADREEHPSVQLKSRDYEQSKHPLSEKQKSTTNPRGANLARKGLIIAGALGRVFDDGIRAVVPAASGVLRGLSIAGIVVGVVLTPIVAAWSFYSSGKRMNRHLHLLCDDLQVVSVYFIIHLCQQCCENKSLLTLLDSDEDSSSSDDD